MADAVDDAEYAESVAQQVQSPGSLGTGTPTSRSSIERWGSTVGTPGENLVAAHKKVPSKTVLKPTDSLHELGLRRPPSYLPCHYYPPYPQATHDALKLLKTGMELNNNAEEGRTAEARRIYAKLLEQTLAQEMSIVNSLRQGKS